jgi:glycosyltransferase involved in cell wall biosynthesis
MKEKIRILFFNIDGSGVNYFRTLTPSIQLDRDHGNDFYVETNNQLDFNDPKTIDYLKSFNVIHYHRQLLQDTRQMVQLAGELKKSGTRLVVEIDDLWLLSKNHPYYSLSIEKKLHIPIIENLKIADYVTTTTEYFAEQIRKVTGKDNVIVLPNAVDPTTMRQFENNWKPDPEGRVRIVYAGGSSHLGDLEQLRGVFNVLHNNPQLKDKFKVILAGFDCEGSTTEVSFNQGVMEDLQKRNLWTPEMVKSINKSRGDVNQIPKLPADLKEKYRNNIFKSQQRDIKSEESVYFEYEKILTDNHKNIENKDYLQWLMNFERDVKYDNEGNYCRVWTKKANEYAKVLDMADVVIAPLADNEFNKCKSELKQTDCWTRKLPVVCSDIIPYNVYGRHMENCILIPAKKNADKDWIKYLKRLILDADLRKRLGENLYEDFKERFHLATVTNKRADFYKKIVGE